MCCGVVSLWGVLSLQFVWVAVVRVLAFAVCVGLWLMMVGVGLLLGFGMLVIALLVFVAGFWVCCRLLTRFPLGHALEMRGVDWKCAFNFALLLVLQVLLLLVGAA